LLSIFFENFRFLTVKKHIYPTVRYFNGVLCFVFTLVFQSVRTKAQIFVHGGPSIIM